jgi:hypothetical protein
MSRGLGRVERRILSLDWFYDSAAAITRMVAESDAPSAAAGASVRRALHGLQRKGLVFQMTRRQWVQTPPTVSEKASKPIDQADREKLVKILGMMGSDHDGEALNAARQAEQIRRRLGLTWEQITNL